MSMPKGFKVVRKYATLDNNQPECSFRAISKTMTKRGYDMNHASVRNHLLRAMKIFANGIANHYKLELSNEELENLSKNSKFQHYMRNLIEDVIK